MQWVLLVEQVNFELWNNQRYYWSWKKKTTHEIFIEMRSKDCSSGVRLHSLDSTNPELCNLGDSVSPRIKPQDQEGHLLQSCCRNDTKNTYKVLSMASGNTKQRHRATATGTDLTLQIKPSVPANSNHHYCNVWLHCNKVNNNKKKAQDNDLGLNRYKRKKTNTDFLRFWNSLGNKHGIKKETKRIPEEWEITLWSFKSRFRRYKNYNATFCSKGNSAKAAFLETNVTDVK